MAFELSVPHKLEITDARARLHALGDYLGKKYGLAVTWNGDDAASISGSYLVVSISGKLELTPGAVSFTGKDPGLLWRSKAKDYLQKKLAKYLDPTNPVDSLPRS